MNRSWLMLAAVNGFVAVAAGAFAAHALQSLPERYLNAFKTGAEYQMYHALALLGVAALAGAADRAGALAARRAATVAGWCLLSGTIIFSGSLYALALTQIGWLGAITPIGGVLMLGGWAALAVTAWQRLPTS
ncbi:MAG: DUF423 domain-containing protein [Phycisphaerales bacterium]|nr:DUF423 domain-containing protein [Phycisphaerales bacterium]